MAASAVPGPQRSVKAAFKRKRGPGGAPGGPSQSPGSPEGTGRSSRKDYERLRRRFVLWSLAATLLLAAATYGLFLDRSIRPDPFTPSPDWLEWLVSNQPHPALARIPVVPIGARGVLTFRPVDTGWINSPYFPEGEVDETPGDPPPAAASLPFIGAAQAQEANEPAPQFDEPMPLDAPNQFLGQQAPNQAQQAQQPQQQSPTQQQAQEEHSPAQQQLPDQAQSPVQQLREPDPNAPAQGVAPDVPDDAFISSESTEERPRIVHAQCLPENRSPSTTCILTFTSDHRFYLYEPAENDLSISRLANATEARIVFFDTPSFPPEEAEGLALSAAATPDYYLMTRVLTLERHSARVLLVERNGRRVVSVPEAPLLPGLRLLRIGMYYYLFGADPGVKAADPTGPVADCMLNCSRADGPEQALVAWEFSPPSEESAGPQPSAVLAGMAGALAYWGQEGSLTPIRVASGTQAHLRSIYFQDDTIGWVSSGWYDGNEEGPRPVVLQTEDGGQSWKRLSYWHLPAPWALYGALPGLLIALFGTAVAWRDWRTLPPPQPGIEDVGASDKPIGWGDPDVLGLQPLARALSRFLRNRSTEPPLTIAVSGPWGSGKSSLMNLVSEDLRSVGTRPVWFNAWHHQKEEHLLAALLANIRSQAIPPLWRGSGLLFRLRLAARRIGHNVLGLLVTILILALAWLGLAAIAPEESAALGGGWMSWMRASLTRLVEGATTFELEPFLQGLFGMGTIGATIVLVAKLLLQLGAFKLNPAALMASLSQKTRVREFSDQLSFRYHFARELEDVSRALRRGPHAGLVIMIDDLDRCRPANVMEVLEAVNFLVSAAPCFVFLGIDKKKVIDAVAAEFKDGNRYLEKLINIEVSIPEATAERTEILSQPPEDEARKSPWPERIRRVMRAAPDALVPAAAAAAVLIALTFLGVGAPPEPEARVATQTSAPAQQGEGAAAEQGLTGGEEPADDAAEETAEITLPTAAPGDLADGPGWLPATVILLFVAAGIVVHALRRTTIREELAVEDSADFRQALGIWHRVIFEANPTPRGIKRHQNRLRFQAMRLRPLDPPPGWLDALFDTSAGARPGWGARLGQAFDQLGTKLFGSRQQGAADGEAADAGRQTIGDPELVAIGALHAYDEAAGSSFLGLLTGASPADPERPLPGVIEDAVREHRARFSSGWPPSREQAEAYAGPGESTHDEPVPAAFPAP